MVSGMSGSECSRTISRKQVTYLQGMPLANRRLILGDPSATLGMTLMGDFLLN